ncbi:MAG: DUF58 domain-containing protein, partial [Thaumarchaeota archaeon]|nr:DUF58 domain-containing protein [Nitrososphaerota archaeon]
RGTEYLWSREYQPGDSLAFVDWKATARFQKLIVKEFLEEGYGAVKVIYDARAHGEVSRDQCSAYFLSSILSYAREGVPISLVVKRGEEMVFDGVDLDPVEAVKAALAYVLESVVADRLDVYEFFEPKSARMLMEFSREVGSRFLRELAELRVREASRRLRDFLDEPRRSFIIYVGCVLLDSDFVSDLAGEAARRGGRLMVFTPPRPWLDAENLEEAYLMHESQNRVLRALERMGVELGYEGKIGAVV